MRTIWFDGPEVVVIDQTRLPADLVERRWITLDDAVAGISEMQVRGAPLIGVAAAHGMALALAAAADDIAVESAAAALLASRPTAVNLRWAVERVGGRVHGLPEGERALAARRCAEQMADEDVAANRSLAEHGAAVLARHRRGDRPLQVMTHCNAGWLAAVDWGTALAPVYLAHQQGLPVHVWVSETRPRLQGALTAWELEKAGVPHTVVVDNAAGLLLAGGEVDCVIVGADRVAANGDVVNKVGTYLKALAAADAAVPFYVAAPTSTIDQRCPTGGDVPIEERAAGEVTHMGGVAVTPAGSAVRNPGFDVTPARLVAALITEAGLRRWQG
jgi:methylthioribose-1-phosphate isomerase